MDLGQVFFVGGGVYYYVEEVVGQVVDDQVVDYFVLWVEYV